jgi:hypothetical protein
MENGLEAALRLYPTKTREIRRLAFASRDFRSLCNDLAEADRTLKRMAEHPTMDEHRREYEVLVEELALEIENFIKVRTA